MKYRILLGVCLFAVLCLQIGESQTITKRVRELCSALRGRPTPDPNGDYPDYYGDDTPNVGPKGAGPNGKPTTGGPFDDYYDYPDEGPAGPGPKGKTPNKGGPLDDYYDYPDQGPNAPGPKGKTPNKGAPLDDYYDYPDEGPNAPGPKGRNPAGVAPDYYDDYPGADVPTKNGPNKNNPNNDPLLDDYEDPLYDENALGAPGDPNDPNSPTNRNSPLGRGRTPKPTTKKPAYPEISLTVVCGGKTAAKRRIL